MRPRCSSSAFVVALVASGAANAGGGKPRPPVASSAIVLPQVASELRIDGELDEPAWRSPARTGPFVDASGATAAPYSDARFLRDDRDLYVALYAADENIQTGKDVFVLELSSAKGKSTFRFNAGGKLLQDVKGARVAVDVDGTVDDASNDDEEWVVEAAIPLSAVPFGADGVVDARVSRCDLTKDHVKRCGEWKGRIARR